MDDTVLDLNAIEATALHAGTIPAKQAHALIAEVRRLRQLVPAPEGRASEPAPGPEEAGWASVG